MKNPWEAICGNKARRKGAVELIRDTQWFGPLPDETSALSMAISDMGLFMSGTPFVLAGGNDSLPLAMAKRLEPDILYGVKVKSIFETDKGLEIKGEKDGKELLHGADYVVCTLPASILRSMEFNPPLPEEQHNAIKNLPYMDITRTYLQVKKPIWQEEEVAAMAITDLSTGHIFGHQPPVNGDKGPALLENLVSGPNATKLARLPKEDLIQKVKDDMQKVYPDFKENFEKAHVKIWSEDPYALGAVSWPAPGDVVKYIKTLGQPHGNIYFAGEHTHILRSTMEGALRSGAQAARQIHER